MAEHHHVAYLTLNYVINIKLLRLDLEKETWLGMVM